MEEDGTCLLDVINDPDALGAFLTSDNQNGQTAKQPVENVGLAAEDVESTSSSSKPSYPDFLSMAMAEAELEPDFSGLDQETFFTATLNPSEMGGLPEQRSAVTLESLVDEDNFTANNTNVKDLTEDFISDESDVQKRREDGMQSHETSASAKTALSAVQRLISQSSQPLQHGALTPDIPTQKMIHYTAEDHPLGKLLSGNLTPASNDTNLVDGSRVQPVSIQVPHVLTTSSNIVNNQQSIFQELPDQQTTSQVMGTVPQNLVQTGKQQLSPQPPTQEPGIQPASKGIQLSAPIQPVNPTTQQQPPGLQQVLLGQSPQIQGAGSMQQLVLGPVQSQIIGANVIGGQANIIPQGQLGTHVLQLHRSQPQLRPKIVLKQGNVMYDGSGGGGVKSGGASTAMKQIQLVLNSQTVLGQMPGNLIGNIQLNGQIVQPQQQQGLIGSSQVIIQNQHSMPQQTNKVKAALIPTVSSTSQPVITVSASEGNIIVLTTPIAPSSTTQSSLTHKASTSTVTSSHVSVSSQVPGSSGSAVSQVKQTKGKQVKSKPKSRKSQQRSNSSKGSATSAVTTVTSSSATNQSKNVQSLGTIPSIQTSSPLPVTSLASSISVSSGALASSVSEVESTNQSPSQFEQGSSTSLSASHHLQTSRSNAQAIGSVPSTPRSAEPAPVISHQAGTVHYRPRRAVPKQQVGKDLGLKQLVQDLRAQGDNERLRSLNQLRQLLQQDPQASQQLQELMKNKFNVSKPEVSVKKVPVSSNDVTKPPNVYLQPQPANSLPFQTSNKLFSSSTPTTGLVLAPVFTSKHDTSGTSTPTATFSNAIQGAKANKSDLPNMSGILDVVNNQPLDPPKSFLSNDGQPVGKSNSLGSSGINLDFLDIQKITKVSSIQSSIGSRILTTQSTPSGNNSTLTSVLQASPKMAVGSTLPVHVSAVSQVSGISSSLSSPASNSSPTFLSPQFSLKTTTSNSNTTELNSQKKTLVTNAELQATVKGLMNVTQNFVTQSREVPPSQASCQEGSSKDEQQDSENGTSAIAEKGNQSNISMSSQFTAAATTVQVPHPDTIKQHSNSQVSPNTAVMQRSGQMHSLTREQINIRAQQQLQQIQARIQQLLSRQARTDQETLQLQQLLQYRQKVVMKAKAQRAQLEQQLKIAQQNLQARGLVEENQSSGSASLSSSGSGSLLTSATSDVTSVISKSFGNSINPQDHQKAFGAFSAMLKGSSQGSANNGKSGSSVNLSSQVTQPPSQYTPSTSSGLTAPEQIQNALITSTTTKQDSPKSPRGGKHKTSESEKKTSSKKMKTESSSQLSQSLNASPSSFNGDASLVKAKLQENPVLSKSMPASQLHPLHVGSQSSSGVQPSPLTKDQANSQRYHQTMKMLEEKLKSMSPAQQKQFLTHYQPLLQKLKQEGQMFSYRQQVDNANSVNLSNVKVEQLAAQRKSTQGNNSKESKSPKRGNSKSTPTLMQLISGGGEVLIKKEEKKVKLPSRTELFKQQLDKDQKLVTQSEIKEEFSCKEDAVTRLLAFHICQDKTPTAEHLNKFDEAFEDHSQQLLEKKEEMLAKYRYLLLKESLRKGPSAEMVMLDRMVLQDERMNFEYEKQLSSNPETQSRLLAIIKPHQSKKQRFLSAAYETHTPVTLKQEPLLPPKKRSHVESISAVKPLETKPPVGTEIPIREPQITKNDFKTKITIKIPKQSYQPALSPAPSSGDTIHSSVSSPDLKSPKSEAGSEAGTSSVKPDVSSPRVRLRRHSTLQALLMSESPLDVSMEDLKVKKKPASKKQSPNPSTVPEKTETKDMEKMGKSKKNNKDGLTNGRGSSKGSNFSEDALSVFDFEDDVLNSSTKDKMMLRTGTASPFEPMDMLQDTLQDEMNSTINSILGLQKTSPRDKGEHSQHQHTVALTGIAAAGSNLRETLPSAVFESHSNDDDFYDSVDTLSKFASYGNMGQPQDERPAAVGASDGNDTVASLQAELDIMMEGDDSLLPKTEEGKPPDPDLEAAVNSILF